MAARSVAWASLMPTPRVDALVSGLLGTCNSIGDEQDDWTQEELLDFDDAIFCCEGCGWWFETSQMAEGPELLCDNCAEDPEE